MFCLFYNAKTKKVDAMNGSGRSGQNVTLDRIRKDLNLADGEHGHIPMNSVHTATVPGAAAGWVDCVERFGSGNVSMEDVLGPAIELSEKGFPVSELSATFVRPKPFTRNVLLIEYSGLLARPTSSVPLPMVRKCLRKMLLPKTAAELPRLEKS